MEQFFFSDEPSLKIVLGYLFKFYFIIFYLCLILTKRFTAGFEKEIILKTINI